MSAIQNLNWYAWINLQPMQPTDGGTLHVIGDIVTHTNKSATLIKKEPDGINPQVLQLEIVLQDADTPVTQPQNLHYVEALNTTGQYSSIEVFYELQLESTITKIDIVS